MSRNPFRWQAPGNSNVFDSDLQNWQKSYITHRTILILKFILERKVITVNEFEQQIWKEITNKIGIPKNHSNIKHFYRPLLFYGFVQEFETKLFVSKDGEMFIKYIENNQYLKAKKHFLLQLFKTSYPNKAVKDIKLALYPFRIFFKILVENKQLNLDDIIKKIPYISNEMEFLDYANLNKEKYDKFKIWVLASLVKLDIIYIDKSDKSYKLNADFLELIKSITIQYDTSDLFKVNELDYSNLSNVRKNITRDKSIVNKIINESFGKCYINEKHRTFPSNTQQNYLEFITLFL